MTDKIGVLGSSTTATIGTATAYTCPAGKAARIRVFYNGVAGANSTLAVAINGIQLFVTGALTVSHCIYSSDALILNDAATVGAVNGSSLALTCMPFAKDYWLAAGQTVTFTIGATNFSSMNFQVVGAEVDVA